MKHSDPETPDSPAAASVGLPESDADADSTDAPGKTENPEPETAGVPAPPVQSDPSVAPPPEESDEVLAELEALDSVDVVTAADSAVEGLEYADEFADKTLTIGSVSEARAIIESFLFASNEPLSVPRLSRLLNNLHPRCVRGLLLELQMGYENRAGALQIMEVAGGFQMATRPLFADWIFRMQKHRRRNPLTPATLETLAIIAYKQPVTKAEIEVIRGVESSAPLHTLQDVGLAEVGGRREVIGRPQLYVTTDMFLKTFGLRSLGDLPSVQELKQLFAEEQKLQPTKSREPAKPMAEEPGIPEEEPAEAGGTEAESANEPNGSNAAELEADPDLPETLHEHGFPDLEEPEP
jgi:segregation and condensation protein B